jgi:alpha-ketoglutarate-dependent taurine dioxygenase
MADIENYLRNKGQALQQGMKQKIKAGFDDPVQQKLAAIAEAKAKQKLAAEAAAMSGVSGSDPFQAPPLPPEVQPNSPTMSLQDQNSRMNAMINAPEAMAALKQKEAQMRQRMEMEDAIRAQEQAEFDPSSYQKVPRFNQLKAAMQPVAKRAPAPPPTLNPPPQSGMIELSEDPEEMQRQIEAAHRGR